MTWRRGDGSAPLVVAGCALAVSTVLSLTAAWGNVRGEGRPLAVTALILSVGAAVAGCLDAALFRPDRRRWPAYFLGLAGTAAALGSVVWLGTARVLPPAGIWGLAVLLCLARPLLGAVQVSTRPRAVWPQLLVGVGIWNAALALYVWLGPGLPLWNELVWPKADQVGLFNHARDLVHARFERFGFMLGFPVLLTPAVLAVEPLGLGRVAGANLVNAFLVPIYAVLVLPSFLWALARAACSAVGARLTTARVAIGMGLTAATLLAYVLLQPGYVTGRDAEMVPRRLLGLVFGPEPLGFVALAGGLWLLTRRREGWNAVPAGIVMGLIFTLQERFIPAGLLLLLCLFLRRVHRRRVLVMAAAAAATFTPQLLYFRFVYGSWLFPNRTGEAWRERAGNWVTRAQARFGVEEGILPPRLSLDYVAANGAEMLQAYWPALVLLLAATLLLVRRHPRQWPLWFFCTSHVGLTLLLSAMYINLDVTYRYNAVALPAAVLLLIAASWTLLQRPAAALREGALLEGNGRGAAGVVVASLLLWGFAWGAIALRYQLLLPSTLQVATISVGNSLTPDFHRILVTETPVEGAKLRRGRDAMGLLTVPDFRTAAFDLDGTDAELFPASRLEGRGSAFYRRRMARVPEGSRLEIRPRVLRVQGPPVIAVVHGWMRAGDPVSGTFQAAAATPAIWRATLPDAFRGRVVSLELSLPRAATTQGEPELRSPAGRVPCARLTRRDRRRVWFRCLRFRAPGSGELRLHAPGPAATARSIGYAVWAWSPPSDVDAVSWN